MLLLQQPIRASYLAPQAADGLVCGDIPVSNKLVKVVIQPGDEFFFVSKSFSSAIIELVYTTSPFPASFPESATWDWISSASAQVSPLFKQK